jgi:DNA topoisomerase-1
VADGDEDLLHVHGGEPGLRRERRGDAFVDLDPEGRPITDAATLERIRALAIPPAWTDVWIAAEPNAHLQATGVDGKGRRQYLYHRAWRERRDHEKFTDMLDFAARLAATVRRATARWRSPCGCWTSASSASAGIAMPATTGMWG